MVQFIVWSIEEKLAAKLRQRDARRGVSVKEEDRCTISEALTRRGRRVRPSFKDHLAKMPDVGGDYLFERTSARMRRVRL